MTLIQLINTDNINQCKSVKSVSSVFHTFNNLKLAKLSHKNHKTHHCPDPRSPGHLHQVLPRAGGRVCACIPGRNALCGILHLPGFAGFSKGSGAEDLAGGFCNNLLARVYKANSNPVAQRTTGILPGTCPDRQRIHHIRPALLRSWWNYWIWRIEGD